MYNLDFNSLWIPQTEKICNIYGIHKKFCNEKIQDGWIWKFLKLTGLIFNQSQSLPEDFIDVVLFLTEENLRKLWLKSELQIASTPFK